MTYAINQNYGSAYSSSEVSYQFRSHMPRHNYSPPPQYNTFVAPQRQFGIVGQGQYFAPAPAISYGSAYASFNAGHASYNKSAGVLSAAVIGAIYSTPMAGGSYPGSLSSYTSSVPYAAWCPPSNGGGWSQQSLTPPFFLSQPAPFNPPYKGMSMGW
jgi:hypothetical protein